MKLKVMSIICCCLFLLGNIVVADEDQEIIRAKIGLKLFSRGIERRAKAFEPRIRAGDKLQIYIIPEPKPAYIYVVYSDENMVIQLNDQDHTKIFKNMLLKLPVPEEGLFYLIDGKSLREYITIICSPVEIPEIAQFLNSQDLSHAGWQEIEEALLEKSQIDLGDTAPKPWIIAGGLRGLPGFMLTDQSFTMLRNENVPQDILANLQTLKDQEFRLEDSFLNAIKEQIGETHVARYEKLILKHAKVDRSEGGILKDDDPFLEKLQIFSGKSLVVKKYEFHVKK